MSPLASAGAALLILTPLLAERAQAGMAAAYSDLGSAKPSPGVPWDRAAKIRCLQSWMLTALAVSAAFLAGFCWGRL
jgi:hypothetical protein